MSTPHSSSQSDRGPAFTGLIVGAILVFAILFATVKVTNASLAGEAGEKAAPEAAK